MQQPQVTNYTDIAEVRTVTGAAACNQLLADGWVLLGVYPLTTVRTWSNSQQWRSGNSVRTRSGMSAGSLGMWSVIGGRRKINGAPPKPYGNRL
jgi:hypothetical protein